MIELENRKEITESFISIIKRDYLKEAEPINGAYKYHVDLQDIKYEVYMSDKELEQACAYTYDIMNELQRINEAGLSKEKLNELADEVSKNKLYADSDLSSIKIVKEFSTERLRQLISEVTAFRKTGGAYAMLISKPFMMNVIHAIYELIVDEFEKDEHKYLQCCYFLLRAIMTINSKELAE